MNDIALHKSISKAARKAPYLQRDEEHALAVRWKENQDQQALSIIAQAHMRLVISVAVKFRSYGLPFNDLIQEGHVGLLEAASRFEPDREVRFSTYATWWIKASVQDYVLRNWSIVRGGTSSAQKSLFFNLRRLRAKLNQGSEQIPAHEMHKHIAQALGVSEKDVANMDNRFASSDSSLNAPVSTEDASQYAERQDFLESDTPLPDEIVSKSVDGDRRKIWLSDALLKLNEREKAIILARRLADKAATLESLGERFGVSKERIRQIETAALQKLKQNLTATGLGKEDFIEASF